MSETPDFKDRISELLRKLFEIVRYRELMRVSLEKAQAELKDDFTRRDAPLEAEMKRIMTELYGLIMGNRPKLLTGAIKSFAMVYGNVSIPKKATSIKVTDSELLESLARKRFTCRR